MRFPEVLIHRVSPSNNMFHSFSEVYCYSKWTYEVFVLEQVFSTGGPVTDGQHEIICVGQGIATITKNEQLLNSQGYLEV